MNKQYFFDLDTMANLVYEILELMNILFEINGYQKYGLDDNEYLKVQQVFNY